MPCCPGYGCAVAAGAVRLPQTRGLTPAPLRPPQQRHRQQNQRRRQSRQRQALSESRADRQLDPAHATRNLVREHQQRAWAVARRRREGAPGWPGSLAGRGRVERGCPAGPLPLRQEAQAWTGASATCVPADESWWVAPHCLASPCFCLIDVCCELGLAVHPALPPLNPVDCAFAAQRRFTVLGDW